MPVGASASDAVDVVAVPRVAAVDDRVARVEQRCERIDGVADIRGRDHDPDRPGRRHRADEIAQRAGAGDAEFVLQSSNRRLVDVVDDAVVSVVVQPSHHVGAHAAEPDHSELHGPRLPRSVVCEPRERSVRGYSPA